MIDLQFLGIENILALRGDPIKNETHFIPNKAGHKYAVNLIEQVVQMNEGNFLHEETGNSTATNFCIGAAGYPEKHFESMNLKTDLKYLKDKVDAGAEFIVTQMFFDNQKYFDFVSACREKGIDVPIIPGLKPITTMKHITFLPKFFHIDFPEELSSELEKCKTNDDVRQVGIEWGIQQSKKLVDYGVPLLHYYTMGKSQTVKAIASEIF